MSDDHHFLLTTAEQDPSAVVPVAEALCQAIVGGRIDPAYMNSVFLWLAGLAGKSQLLREAVSAELNHEKLQYHLTIGTENAQRLVDVLALDLPAHYFDICRDIVVGTTGCLFIVGAGFSYDSAAPLLKETRFLATHVLHGLGESDPASLYDSDEREAWRKIGAGGWKEFQQLATGLLKTKTPSEPHRILAKLFNEAIVRHIISFNWDDLIEKAYQEEFGEAIPVVSGPGTAADHALWKLHGDINSPTERWVLPYEDGRVFDELTAQLGNEVLATFIVGYSEQEPTVKERLIADLESRGGVIRISPSQVDDPPRSFKDDATSALRKLASGFAAAKQP